MDTTRILVMLSMASGSFLLAATPEAHAGFVGQTVTAEWLFPDFTTVFDSHDVVVGPGIELPDNVIVNGGFNIDIGDDYIQFNSLIPVFIWTNMSFNGWRFSDTFGTIPEIIGFEIDSFTLGITGLEQADLDFDAESVWGNFAGVQSNVGGFIRLSVIFVPAPGSLVLLGLAGLMGTRRRR